MHPAPFLYIFQRVRQLPSRGGQIGPRRRPSRRKLKCSHGPLREQSCELYWERALMLMPYANCIGSPPPPSLAQQDRPRCLPTAPRKSPNANAPCSRRAAHAGSPRPRREGRGDGRGGGGGGGARSSGGGRRRSVGKVNTMISTRERTCPLNTRARLCTPMYPTCKYESGKHEKSEHTAVGRAASCADATREARISNSCAEIP
jgi:hypothetical protein